jgi:hypothetical protein
MVQLQLGVPLPGAVPFMLTPKARRKVIGSRRSREGTDNTDTEFANHVAGRPEYHAAQLEGYERQADHRKPGIRAAALRWAAELVLGEAALVTQEETLLQKQALALRGPTPQSSPRSPRRPSS